uniref:Histone H5 n=1 Tax=Parascaris univalens TaxID=6257 RepID=A0A915A0X7_PARUN
MEQLKAEDVRNGAQWSSSSESDEDADEISGREVEKQESLRRRMAIREQQRLEETSGVPVKESDAYQHIQMERECANKKEQVVDSDDFMDETETDFGLSQRWENRKSYAHGQGFGIINRQHLTAAGRCSTRPFKLARSDVKDLANEVVKAVEERELQSIDYAGDSDATFTVTDPKAQNIAQPIVSDEELAARTLTGLSEAASVEVRLASIFAADASSALGKEVTIISRTMELEESSSSKEAPKNRWDDATITENRIRSELGSSTFDGDSIVAPTSFKSSIAKSFATTVSNEANLAHEDPCSPFRVPSFSIARVQRPSLAPSQIADRKSLLYTPKRPARSSIVLNEYLCSGGTPRPNTSAENTRSMPFASRTSSKHVCGEYTLDAIRESKQCCEVRTWNTSCFFRCESNVSGKCGSRCTGVSSTTVEQW